MLQPQLQTKLVPVDTCLVPADQPKVKLYGPIASCSVDYHKIPEEEGTLGLVLRHFRYPRPIILTHRPIGNNMFLRRL